MSIKICLAFIIFAASTFVNAENTVVEKIDRVQFNADSGKYFAYRNAGWGVCDNNPYVVLRGKLENRQIFISQVLAAHMAGKKVRFSGTCTNANGYLDATYIIVY